MRIENVNRATFKANFVNKSLVGKVIDNNCHNYTDRYVSFVKIDPFNARDIDALKSASDYWISDRFSKNIYYAACALKNSSKFYRGHEVYALTSQPSDFEKLDSEKILGLVHIAPFYDTPLFIEHLQVNPEYLPRYSMFTKTKEPEYKGIGTSIINALKQMSNKISCFPSSEKSVKDFYIKNGFNKHQDISNYYVWEKK